MIGLTLSKWYKDIADAIRAKGISDTFKPSEMAAAIRSIGGGGGGGGGDDVLLKYTDDMGYADSGTVIENKLCNIIALAVAANKDLKVTFKKGSASYDDYFLTFYFNEHFRFGCNNTIVFWKIGGETYHSQAYDPSKDFTMIIHTDTKKFEFIQDGTTLDIIDFWSQDMRMFNNLSGTTSIYAEQNWIESLTVALV